MKFDIFCEIQRADISTPEQERALLADTIEEARAADKSGFDVWWQVEHHGAPEFSYSAAPELILTDYDGVVRRYDPKPGKTPALERLWGIEPYTEQQVRSVRARGAGGLRNPALMPDRTLRQRCTYRRARRHVVGRIRAVL